MWIHKDFRRFIIPVFLGIFTGSAIGKTIQSSSKADSLLPIDPFAAYRLYTEYTPSEHRRIAESLLALGEIDKAIPHLKSAGDRFSLGRAYFLKDDREAAYEIFSRLGSPDAHLLAGICVEDTNPLLALDHFRRAKKGLSMIDDYISLKIVDKLVELGRVREALSTLRQAIENYPELEEREEVKQELSRIYLMMGYPMLARNQLVSLLSRDYPRHKYSIALLEKEMGWNPEEVFKEILREYPRTVWAAQSFDHLTQEGNLEIEDYLYAGIAYSTLKDYEKAAEFLNTYLAHSPGNEKANFELGVISYKLAKYEDAYEVLSHVRRELVEDAIFYRARCKERLGAMDEALSEYRKIPRTSPNFPRATYYAGRLHEEAAKFDKAIESYRALRRGFPNDPLADDACFRTGFLLNSLGRLTEATREFRDLARLYPQSPFLEASLYWMAKSTHDDEEKHRILSKLFEINPLGYYTKLASDSFNLDLPELKSHESNFPSDSPPGASMRKGLLFLRLGLLHEAEQELSQVGAEHNHLLSFIYHRYAITPNAIRCAYRAEEDLLKILYPRTHILTLERMSRDPFLMLALVREESRFDPRAISRSGAIGLAQIMPATGAMIAEQLGYEDFRPESLFDADTNLRFGSFYLEEMIKRFGNLEYALAAYNAGPHRVTEWLSRLHYDSLDQFVENIPFSETRKYVKRVIASYWSYSRIYGESLGSRVR